MTTYIDAISRGFPKVQCHAAGDGSIYGNIIWDAGDPVPSQETLDAWISANPNGGEMEVTKYEFRKLFTLSERVAIDNFENSTSIPDNYKAMLRTILKDLELSAVVFLDNPDVIAGVHFTETLGLIGPGRANRILANLPPV